MVLARVNIRSSIAARALVLFSTWILIGPAISVKLWLKLETEVV